MKSLNEKMAELMGDKVTTENGRPQIVTLFRGHLKNYEDWTPDSDLNQAMAVVMKLDWQVTICSVEAEVFDPFAEKCVAIEHKRTNADIARAICTGINEIMGGGE